MGSNWSEDLGLLKKRYSIPTSLFEQILEIIIEQSSFGCTSDISPTAVITGAQPGAGKTELQKVAEAKFRGNVVICNADNFRDYHPLAHEIKLNFPEHYPDLTADYAQKWNDRLCEYCRENRLNYILETTFPSGNRLSNTIVELKENGYRVDIMLLAVHPRLSLLGTYMRYEDSMEKTGLGRKVSREAHDLRFNSITETIRAILTPSRFDNIYIFSRSIVLEYSDLIEGVTLVAHNPKDPLSVYREEIQNPWQEKLKEYFRKSRVEVLRKMHKRASSQREIDLFKKELNLTIVPRHEKQVQKQENDDGPVRRRGPRR